LVGQFHNIEVKKPWTTKDTKYHEGFSSQGFPSCTFVPFVINGFAN